MKILVYGLNYAPEPVGAGRYTGELGAWLAAAGHEVRAIAAPPYYPAWQLAEGDRGWRYRRERRDGVEVWRAPLWVPARPGGLARLLHLASFALSSLPLLLRQAAWRPDVIWLAAPAFACAPAAWLAARAAGAKAWLHVQDYEVDVAFEMGLLRGRWLHRIVSASERWMFRRFDRVSSISQAMCSKAVAKGVLPQRVSALPNWVDVQAIRPLAGASPYRAELGIAADTVVALYSGSMGAKHGIEGLGDLALRMAGDLRLVFVFCGEGPGMADLQARCGHLGRVRLLPLQPLERLGDLLGLADVHLLPQKADAADLVMPSKLTGMLSSGRPVLATAHPGSELAQVLQGCGEIVPPGDAAAFAAALAALAADPGRRRALGAQARAHAEQHLDKQAVLQRFEQELLALIGPARRLRSVPIG